MQKKTQLFALIAALAVVLVVGVVAQQKAADKAIDPVCGMTVVKANAKATFDFKGTTYYFCSTGCKEAFAKEPEKYLKAQQEKAVQTSEAKVVEGFPLQMGHMQGQMGQMGGQMGMMKHEGMVGCPMCGGQGMMPGGMGKGMAMGMRGHGMMPPGGMPLGPMAPGLAQLLMMYGDKIEVTVENAKDGAALKITSKDPEVVKAIQVHLSEHLAMMKKMREAAAKAPAEGACADCPMMKK
jgi:YHS domain-containing protein